MYSDKNVKTRSLLISHIEKYPKLNIEDIFKFVYHSAFGCEHLVTSMEAVRDYIVREYNCFTHTYMEDVEVLDGEYSRVSLSLLSQGLSVNTLATLFYISSRDKAEEKDGLTRRLDVVRELARDGITPFSTDALEKAINAWAQKGYPAIHHSDKFREEYVPSYRVISNRFIPFLPLFIELDKRMVQGRTVLAIEGGSASGKTTLGNILYEIYGCTVFHMDDFFLQPHQRTPERYNEIGGNVDRERFVNLNCKFVNGLFFIHILFNFLFRKTLQRV